MKNTLKHTAILLAGASLIALAGCTKAPANTAYDFAHEISDLSPDENVIYGKLENGMRYAIMVNKTPTNSASMRLRFNTGSLNETDDIQGLAHFLEHMAFNGSDNMPEGEMTKTLERYGLAFGADTNAYTSFDETVYMLELPSSSDEMFDVTFGIMRETADRLTLDEDAIDRERGVVKSEKRRRDSAAYRAQMASLDFYLGESRIPYRLPIGQTENLDAVKSAQFRSYYEGYYRPENAFLVVVGDFDPAAIEAKIKENFADWTAEGEAIGHLNAGTVSKSTQRIGYFSDPEVQTSITISKMGPMVERADTADNRKQNLLISFGNSILNRRIATLAQKPDAKFIGGGAASTDLYGAGEISTLSISTEADNWQDGLNIAEQELRRALEFGFTQDELDEQIANYRKSLQVSVQTSGTRRTPGLASQLTGSFGNESVFTTPQSSLERFESYADTITIEAVFKAWKDRWAGTLEAPLLYLQSSKPVADHDAVILATYKASAATQVDAPMATGSNEFAYTNWGEPGEIISRDHIEDLDIHRIKFDNNVRLNVKKTDFEDGSLRIMVRFGDGFLSLPADNTYVQEFSDYVMGTGGLVAHSEDDLRRIMAGKSVGVRFGTASETFYLSGSTTPDNLRDQLNLMAAYLTAPGYRPEAKASYDKRIRSWYPTLDSTPGGVSQRDVPRLIRSGDARFGIPAEAQMLAIDNDQVRAWMDPQMANGAIEISIIGDIDIDETIKQVGATFGALDLRDDAVKDYPQARMLTFPAGTSKPVTLTHEGEANRSSIQVYWPAPDGTDILRSRRIGVLEQIFSNRLVDVIREEDSATYSPSAFRYSPQTYPNYGYVGVSLDLKPEDVGPMFIRIDEIAADFAAGNITDDEFDRAIKPVREKIEESEESNSYWGGVIAQAQTDEQDLDNARTRKQVYQDMTLEDLKPLAKSIFVEPKAYRVQILPQAEQ